MSKIAALDLGDQWIGIALSDSLKMFARPFTTIKAAELDHFLKDFIEEQKLETIVIGLPKTMSGTLSKQTEKIIALKEQLAIAFSQVPFVLWDERLSSKRAVSLQKTKKEQSKQTDHAIAAAFILDSYLLFLKPTSLDSEHSY